MKAKLNVLIAMVTFGTVSIFVKNIPLSTGEISLYRASIGFLVILLYQLFSGNRIKISEIKQDLPLLFISGICIGFGWVLLFQAFKYTTVSLATLSHYFAPVLLIILSVIIFKEKLSIKQLFCFVMATLGLIIIITSEGLEITNTTTIGVLYGLASAVLYATVLVINKRIKNVTGIDRTLIQFFAGTMVLTPYVLATSGINILSLEPKALISVLILGGFHTGFMYFLFFSSIKDLSGQEVAILSYAEPLVSIIVSLLVFREPLTLMQIIGGAMILGFTLLNELNISIFNDSEVISKSKIENFEEN